MKKFVKNNLGLKIKTPNGYKDFEGVAYMGDKIVYDLSFSNRKKIKATDNHKFLTDNGLVEVKDLNISDRIMRSDGRFTKLVSKSKYKEIPVYDIIEADGNIVSYNGVFSHQCKFITDEETLINPLCLTRLKSYDPVFYTEQVRWYIEPIPNKAYLVALDPSMGTGGDFAAIQVFVLPELKQVAEWQNNNSDPRKQVLQLMKILNTLFYELSDHPDQYQDPEIYWTFENNSLGEAILQIIDDTGLDKFPGQIINEKKRKGKVRRFRKGLCTTTTSKLASCTKFKSLIESDRMIVNSKQSLKELKSFISKGKSYSAKNGEHDDLISACLLIVRMLETVGNFTEIDDLKETITDEEIWGMPIL